MPMQPKGAKWGLKALFGNEHGQKGGCVLSFITVGMAGVLTVWRMTEHLFFS